MSAIPEAIPDYELCCTLDENHEGPCVWVCQECEGTGKCWVCDDESDFCDECSGTGECGNCEGGTVTAEL